MKYWHGLGLIEDDNGQFSSLSDPQEAMLLHELPASARREIEHRELLAARRWLSIGVLTVLAIAAAVLAWVS